VPSRDTLISNKKPELKTPFLYFSSQEKNRALFKRTEYTEIYRRKKFIDESVKELFLTPKFLSKYTSFLTRNGHYFDSFYRKILKKKAE
jgi:hypothetical protein